MKKLFSAVTATVCAAACLFSFAACGGQGEGAQHTEHHWSSTYVNDGDRHYQTCDGCDEKNYSSHSYNEDGVCVCGKQQDTAGGGTEAELMDISTYFSGIKVAENKTVLTDASGANTLFEEVLDKQFEVLAQDILYRLYLVYGENTYGAQSTFQDLVLDYTYNGNSAKVIKSTALTDLTEHSINHLLYNIDCIECYQKSINVNDDNDMNSVATVIFANAIYGDYCLYNSAKLVLNKHDNQNNSYDPTPYKWQYNDYTKWNTDYRTAFKYELAKVVYGDKNTNLTYDELLAKINTTGFAADTEQKIIDTIYSKVIGDNLVAENLRIYNTFSESDKSNLKNWTGAEEEKHYFKGYNITVPAVVKQALNNTFENTDVRLYPVVLRQSVNVSNNFDNITVSDNTRSIVLMPKANAPVTKLAFEISGEAGQTVALSFEIVSGGEKRTVTKTVTLTAEKQTVEVDLSGSGLNAMGAFNGNTTAYTSTALFGNPDGADGNGEHYVALNLQDNAVSFALTFTGLYDR